MSLLSLVHEHPRPHSKQLNSLLCTGKHESAGIGLERYVKEYAHWHLVLQPEENRQKRGLAAGLIIAKRKVMLLTDLTAEEWADLANIFAAGDAPQALCEKVGATFTGHFTAPAFNNGKLAGQTQAQVHGHIYPVIEEELPTPGARNGMGAMVEALRSQEAE